MDTPPVAEAPRRWEVHPRAPEKRERVRDGTNTPAVVLAEDRPAAAEDNPAAAEDRPVGVAHMAVAAEPAVGDKPAQPEPVAAGAHSPPEGTEVERQLQDFAL